MKHLLCILTICFLFLPARAQVTGLVENFDDNLLDGWEAPGDATRTFELQAVDSTLQIQYHRVASSWEWDNFNWTPPQKVDATAQPYITLRVRSDVVSELTLKPIYDNGSNDWLQAMLPADGQWHTYRFELLAPAPRVLNRIYFYLDGGTTVPKSGTVYFDDLRLADSVRAADLLDISQLERAINAAQALYQNSTEGDQEGQFPTGSKSQLQAAIHQAQAVFNQEEVSQQELDQATWDLYDACARFEASVNGPAVPLVDPNATLQTRYLYLNLDFLKDRALLFGMHDATGYGVGWSGDDDRSDIKDVCGDFPAFYSEEMYKVTRHREEERVRYRMTSAYQRGGVLSMCWHQYDPQGRGFYADDVNGENVVATLLPEGQYHQQYKEKLKSVALFFKSLRGPKGESIPVIFRLYHEHNGGWFWWGKGRCSTEQFNALWRFTVEYLRDSLQVHNLLYAISPSLNQADWGRNYKDIFPGEDYVDVYGVDHYFGDVITNPDRENFKQGLTRIVRTALRDQKLPALTEVGQEGLDTPDFFTNVLLWAMVSDSLNNYYSYAAVWRNQDINHHFAPYPGHPSVPDFLKFFNDPYTLFESDLPDMYAPLTADSLPPEFVAFPEPPFVATDTLFFISIKTDEKAFLRYDFQDLPFDSMAHEFSEGQGRLEHRTTLHGQQGERFSIYVRASDLIGNTSPQSLHIEILVDTLQRPVYWFDLKYDLSDWPKGKAPFAFEGQSEGQTKLVPVRTVYLRRNFTIEDKTQINKLAAIINYDNGFALYLNGREIHRENLGEGTLSYSTWAATNSDGVKQVLIEDSDLAALKNGSNVLAIEIHQAVEDSFDLKFDLKLITASYQTLIDYQADWFYYAEGGEPPVQKLGTVSVEERKILPYRFRVVNQYPNPFNQQTTLSYYLPGTGKVELVLYNVMGQRVKKVLQGLQSAGLHRLHLNLSGFPSGVYFYRLQYGKENVFGKLILIK